MKPKEWLFQNGHIESIGRGRLAAHHKALIEEALSKDSSLHIEGFSVTTVATAQTEGKKAERTPKESTGILDVPDPLRDARDFTLVLRDTGKPVPGLGMKNVCNGCHNSFTYCPCPNPRVWVDADIESVVSFKSVS